VNPTPRDEDRILSTILSRWRGRLRTRQRLEAAAKADHTAAQRALDQARRDDIHPRGHLVTARDRETRRLRLRREQIAYAERVIRRHSRRPLTGRQKAVAYAKRHAGRVMEQPAGSNRGGLITVWQRSFGDWLVGQPWCGVFAGICMQAGGAKGVTSRVAAVAFIEDDARATRGPYAGWSGDPRHARPGDLVVLFGRGVHVEIVTGHTGGALTTVGGNTSAGATGSQSNGGGCFRRVRPYSAVHGIAHVRYPS
jgi:hypothetical protein